MSSHILVNVSAQTWQPPCIQEYAVSQPMAGTTHKNLRWGKIGSTLQHTGKSVFAVEFTTFLDDWHQR